MQRYGKTASGKQRYYCASCKISSVRSRPDTIIRHQFHRFVSWIVGKKTLAESAKIYGMSVRNLQKQFQKYSDWKISGSKISKNISVKYLILDAKYLHGKSLCVLVGLTENQRLFFRFADRECEASWSDFISRLPTPLSIVADGQKGLRKAVKRLWSETAIQKCHFHFVALLIQYLSRHPKTTAGRELLRLAYRLKRVKDKESRDEWIQSFEFWQHIYLKEINLKNEQNWFVNKKLRSAKLIVKRSLPDLFTYLDYPGLPSTTNLVEGWVNAAIAETLRRHRGVRLNKKKTLVSVLLSFLSDKNR